MISQNILGFGNNQAGRDINFVTNRLSSILEKILPTLLEKAGQHDLKFNSYTFQIPNKYKIDEKVEYNNIKYPAIINDYSCYGYLVDSIYDDILENEVPGAKSKILRMLKSRYQMKISELTSKYPDSSLIVLVRESSDEIFREICLNLQQDLRFTSLILEDIDIGSLIIVSHAFINCKILEAPLYDT